MKEIKYYGIKPKAIIDESGKKTSYPYAVSAVLSDDVFSITVSVTNGTYLGPSSFEEDETAVIELTANEHYALPETVSVEGATAVYDALHGTVTLSDPTSSVTVSAVCLGEPYTITVSITDGTYSGDSVIRYGGTASVTLVADANYELPDTISVEGATASYDSSTGVVSLSSPTGNVTLTAVCESSGPIVDPVLGNNSWETIGLICDAGTFSNYWALGDTKTDTGTDSVTRTMRVCDIYHSYSDKVVFEQVELEEAGAVWDADNVNDYELSDMRVTYLPSMLAKYSSDLQAFITNTSVKVAKGGNDGTIVTLSDKLFLPAEGEIFASRSYSRTEEYAVVTRFTLYANNDTTDFRKKYKPSTPTSANGWWLRSPYSGNTYGVCYVASGGGNDRSNANGSLRVAPCFAR